jgi:ribosomal protein L19
MARIARLVVPGHPHHVTQRGVRSIAIFRDDADRQAYLRYMGDETKRFGVEFLNGRCGPVEKPEKGSSECELQIFSGTILNEQNGCKFDCLSGTRVSNLQWSEF